MTRRIAPAAAGIPALEPIAQDLYDTKGYVDATTTTLNFFINPNPGGELFTNMVASGQLPHPQQFHCFGIAVEIMPAISDTDAEGVALAWMGDKKKLRETALLTLRVGAKDYLQMPLTRIPEGLGPVAFGEVYTVLGGALDVWTVTQGVQDVKHAYEVTVPQRGKIKPIHIPAQQSFFVKIEWPNGALTLDAGVVAPLIRCYLVGVLWREVQ